MAPTTTGKSSLVDQMLSLIKPQSHVELLPAPGLHPLDPLTAGEITAAGKACREHAQKLSLKSIRFNAITLQVQACAFRLMIERRNIRFAVAPCDTPWLNLGTCDLLQEPPKAALLEYEASGRRTTVPRCAFVIVQVLGVAAFPSTPIKMPCLLSETGVLVQLPSLPGSCVAEVLVDLSSPTPAILQWNKVC